jgi:hypothetical protein
VPGSPSRLGDCRTGAANRRPQWFNGQVARSLRCLIGWHKWAKRLADDGATYLVCRRCGKEGDAAPRQWRYSDYG